MSADRQITREQAFTRLRALGADQAVVEFSGGNDEGGADSIVLRRAGETLRELPSWPEPPANCTPSEAQLIDALAAPVYEVYGTFAGDFDVTGEVIWDVSQGTVQMIRDERADYEHSEYYL
ncbi:MAG TPA: hypothetical protein VHT27_01905 [Solirubrobacteraceae bacterium]|jgi:hypothetical protein|nr:hypothetical protein [Solirubrobacteraceae bacterium]